MYNNSLKSTLFQHKKNKLCMNCKVHIRIEKLTILQFWHHAHRTESNNKKSVVESFRLWLFRILYFFPRHKIFL